MVAMSIDAVLPALATIGTDLGVKHDNDRQMVISIFFLGLAISQILYGALSDAFGRKSAIYVGFAIFIVDSVFSMCAISFTMMLVGRFLRGFGAAGPRTVVIAMVRDRYEGPAMARIMSFIMTVFILVPALAPAIGQGVLVVSHWRAIFGLLFGLGVGALLWFALRQPETLALNRRISFELGSIWQAVRETCLDRVALGYAIAAGLVFGAFVGYLTSAQQIFQELYDTCKLFPLYFVILSLSVGAASSVIGSITTAISVILGAIIGFSYDGTVLPLISGFAGLALMSLLVTRWAEMKS
ncbi:MAG: DHA1 family bicyclomycin/chloramphenicol resistance-like MFS transporter [Gammaproteobacteria bacterium]|jgi:DHA1 family bicyclomycin/chloramphenicol resistance-like MFS transporter